MKKNIFLYIFSIIFFNGYGQNPSTQVKTSLGKSQIFVDQPFSVRVNVINAGSRPEIIFPEIKPLVKRGFQANRQALKQVGKPAVSHSFIQEYMAPEVGRFEIAPFHILVDGVAYPAEGFALLVKNTLEDSASAALDSVAREQADSLAASGVFLALTTDRPSAFLREMVGVRLSLFVAKNAPVNMEFYNLSEQLGAIIAELKPRNCWEESIRIDEILPRNIMLRGGEFTEYRLYQSYFFALSQANLLFPSVSLKMTVNDDTLGDNLRTYTSQPQRVRIKPLPPHPESGKVAVGMFKLTDKTDSVLVLGESADYSVQITGIGNISSIQAPDVRESPTLMLSASGGTLDIRRSPSGIQGSRVFDYYLTPLKSGDYFLENMVKWIYFNPKLARYDTLTSKRKVRVEEHPDGEMKDNPNSIYAGIDNLSTSEGFVSDNANIRLIMNGVVILIFLYIITLRKK